MGNTVYNAQAFNGHQGLPQRDYGDIYPVKADRRCQMKTSYTHIWPICFTISTIGEIPHLGPEKTSYLLVHYKAGKSLLM
jgi:hypothetical protein